MVLGGVQAFNLVSILLLVLPGLVGTKLYLRGVNRQDRFGRLDTVIISFTGSLVGLLCLYLWYWIWLGVLTTEGIESAPLWEDLSGHIDATPELVFHYAVLVSLVAVGGHALGYFGLLVDQLPPAPNKAWRTLHEGTQGRDDDGADFVRIYTESGREVTGKVDEWIVDSRSLTLKNAEYAEDDAQSGELSGSRVYFHEDEIARVHAEKPRDADGRSRESPASDVEPNDNTEDLVETAESADNESDE